MGAIYICASTTEPSRKTTRILFVVFMSSLPLLLTSSCLPNVGDRVVEMILYGVLP